METYRWIPNDYGGYLIGFCVVFWALALLSIREGRKRPATITYAGIVSVLTVIVHLSSGYWWRFVPGMAVVWIGFLVLTLEQHIMDARRSSGKVFWSAWALMAAMVVFLTLLSVQNNSIQLALGRDVAQWTWGRGKTTAVPRNEARVRKIGNRVQPQYKITNDQMSIFLRDGEWISPRGEKIMDRHVAQRAAQWTGRPIEENFDRPGTNPRVTSLE